MSETASADVESLHRAVNGLDIEGHRERASYILETMLDGLSVGAGNREMVRNFLTDHFAAAHAAGIAEGERREREACAEIARGYERIGKATNDYDIGVNATVEAICDTISDAAAKIRKSPILAEAAKIGDAPPGAELAKEGGE